MSEPAPFPPRVAEDVDAYDHREMVDGYMEYKPDDPFPGDNRSPAYRWGWQNGHRDHSDGDDGYDFLRRQLAKRIRRSA